MESNNGRVYICIYCRLAKLVEDAAAQPVRLSTDDLENENLLLRGDLLFLDFRGGRNAWAHDDLASKERIELIISNVRRLAPKLPIVVLTSRLTLIDDYSKLKGDFDILDVVIESLLTPNAISSLLSSEELFLPDEYYLSIELAKEVFRAELRDARRSLVTTYEESSGGEIASATLDRNILESIIQEVQNGREYSY